MALLRVVDLRAEVVDLCAEVRDLRSHDSESRVPLHDRNNIIEDNQLSGSENAFKFSSAASTIWLPQSNHLT